MSKTQLKQTAKKAAKHVVVGKKAGARTELYVRVAATTKKKLKKIQALEGYQSMCETTDKLLTAMCDQILSGKSTKKH